MFVSMAIFSPCFGLRPRILGGVSAVSGRGPWLDLLDMCHTFIFTNIENVGQIRVTSWSGSSVVEQRVSHFVETFETMFNIVQIAAMQLSEGHQFNPGSLLNYSCKQVFSDLLFVLRYMFLSICSFWSSPV